MKIGDVVAHPNAPDWGNGTVLQYEPGAIAVIEFEHVGTKTLHLDKASIEFILLGEAIDVAWTTHEDFSECARIARGITAKYGGEARVIPLDDGYAVLVPQEIECGLLQMRVPIRLTTGTDMA